jgi:hypothetical protein
MAKVLQTWTLQLQPIMNVFQTIESLLSEFKTVVRITSQCLKKMSKTLQS